MPRRRWAAVAAQRLSGRDAQGGVGFFENLGGYLEALDPAQFDIFVLDVDEHVGIHFVEGTEELGPVRDVVALAEGDEVPRGWLRPFVGPLVAAEVCAVLFGG